MFPATGTYLSASSGLLRQQLDHTLSRFSFVFDSSLCYLLSSSSFLWGSISLNIPFLPLFLWERREKYIRVLFTVTENKYLKFGCHCKNFFKNLFYFLQTSVTKKIILLFYVKQCNFKKWTVNAVKREENM